MTLPKAQPANLPATFHHANWTIKYTLLAPPSPIQPTQTLIFIHGTPWSSTVFLPLANSLQTTNPTLRILLYDLPGYGQSQHLDTTTTTSNPTSKGFAGTTSVHHQATALSALLAHLNLSSPAPSILAHDIGGAIALRAHLLHGIEFSRLLLSDANAVLPWGDGFYSLARAEPSVFQRLPGHIWEAVVRAAVRSGSLVGLRGGWEEELVAPWLGSRGQEAFVRQVAQAEDGDVEEMVEGGLYGRVRCGVRVVWGEGDGWVPREKVEGFSEMVGERLEGFEVVEGAGHLVMLDQPERFEGILRDWLGL
ncbi:hypothetical protein WHR41_00973 [Cladosporium halotolerans]|uniref:AB hydrolase-1 domain-containing protein n=1 Tax=Cladosporium halotolerans TaxID=1052096 RepID=A0AB34L426_9PEZI